jgi:FtsZ-binding cell division protein ZapB
LEKRIRQYIEAENDLKRENGNLNDEIDEWKNRYRNLEQLYSKS